MKVELTRLFEIVPLFFKAAARNVAYTKLTKHIMNLNQQNSVQGIINEMALCLKDILNYRLFASVIQRGLDVDVWLDPRMYRKSLESVFIQDFQLTGESQINYLNQTFQDGEREQEFNLENLISYSLYEDNCQGKIYMLPSQNMPEYHDDIVEIIIKSTGVALSKQINIEQLTNAATIDPLTGCYNRREFERQMKKSIANAKREKEPLSIFIFDIDHFKRVNDTYGHQAGDAVLQKVSGIVKDNMRSGDTLSRYGGEEFIAILPSTSKIGAMEIADRLRQKIEKETVITDTGAVNVTASFGISSLNPSYKKDDSLDMTKLIEYADEMMYKAKLNGRNRVMPGLIHLCQAQEKDNPTKTYKVK
ncbi:MAG: GGDEF domain-containing protein [Desulfamplus sp.]|nr:GGDEF domain-containing protein [Desulfamplus sp.]